MRGIHGSLAAFKHAFYSVAGKRLLSTCSARWSVMERHLEDNVTLESIQKAAKRIEPYITRTPILSCQAMNSMAGRKLYFHCDIFQKAGSFKYRGASNSVLQIKEERNSTDFVVVTHSRGNHGPALALASSLHKIENRIVFPNNAFESTKAIILGYGGTVIMSGPTPQDRQAVTDEIMAELGDRAEFIPTADHPFMMMGAGTIGLELLEEIPQLDAVVACVGTGGLLGGIAVACRQSKPSISLYGAEPLEADDAARSFRQKERIILTEYTDSVADGLNMGIGQYTWPIIRDNVTDILTVTEEEIIRAKDLLWERMRLEVEPSGAVSLAVVLSEEFRALPKEIEHVAITLSGGNVDLPM